MSSQKIIPYRFDPRAEGVSPIQNRGPGPARPTRSPGFARWHCCNDRHPQPMHCVSPARSRCSSAICSSTRLVHADESFAQSARSGTRFCGKLRQLRADFLQRQADFLGEDDEGDAPEDRARITAVAGAGPLRGDQPALLVEPQRRGGHAAAAGHLGDGHEVGPYG